MSEPPRTSIMTHAEPDAFIPLRPGRLPYFPDPPSAL